MPKVREGGEHERGIIPPLVRGVLGAKGSLSIFTREDHSDGLWNGYVS